MGKLIKFPKKISNLKLIKIMTIKLLCKLNLHNYRYWLIYDSLPQNTRYARRCINIGCDKSQIEFFFPCNKSHVWMNMILGKEYKKIKLV